MPWTYHDAHRHNHKATTYMRQHIWAEVANSALQNGADEAQAIREANAVLDRWIEEHGGERIDEKGY